MKNRVEKKEIVNGVSYAYSTDWIYSLESEEHWRLYWRQQRIVEGKILPGERVMEIGIGSGFAANYLRSKGVDVVTLDIDAEKTPDIAANIVTYEFNETFDHVLALEVFEHIPFIEFEKTMIKISGVCRKYMFTSVPCNELSLFQATIKIPLLRERYIQIAVPRGRVVDKHHFWEAGHKDTPALKFENVFRDAGFSLASREKAFSRLFYSFKRAKS